MGCIGSNDTKQADDSHNCNTECLLAIVNDHLRNKEFYWVVQTPWYEDNINDEIQNVIKIVKSTTSIEYPILTQDARLLTLNYCSFHYFEDKSYGNTKCFISIFGDNDVGINQFTSAFNSNDRYHTIEGSVIPSIKINKFLFSFDQIKLFTRNFLTNIVTNEAKINFINDSQMFIVVYSIDNRKSFEYAKTCLNDIYNIKKMKKILEFGCILVCTKCDLLYEKCNTFKEKQNIIFEKVNKNIPDMVSFEEGIELAKQFGIPFAQASINNHQSIRFLFELSVRNCLVQSQLNWELRKREANN